MHGPFPLPLLQQQSHELTQRLPAPGIRLHKLQTHGPFRLQTTWAFRVTALAERGVKNWRITLRPTGSGSSVMTATPSSDRSKV